MLTVVAFRNLIELYGTESDLTEGFILPKSFGWFRGNNVIWTISYVILFTSAIRCFLIVTFACSLCSR
jgi:ascorbate-specific PTS system EIIC-type component UlaA